MKHVQSFGLVVAALALSVTSCWAQPPAPAAPAEAGQTLQRLRDEILQREIDGQKRARARRDQGWQRSRKYLRDSLGRAGFGDRTLQNAVLDFIEEQDLAREEVREAAAACYRALDDQQLDDPEVQKLLDDYQSAAKRAQSKRDAALAQLDTQAHFSTNPRLKTFLTLRGLIGTEASVTEDTLSDSAGIMAGYELKELFPVRLEPKLAAATPAVQ